jgi:hypothetical protein
MSLGLNFSRTLLITGALGCFAVALFAQQDDPPARVARLNYLTGSVSMRPAAADDWINAEPNRPFTNGDSVYTDMDGRAEFHSDIAAIRVGPSANLRFAQLTDQEMQLQLSDGDIHLHVHHLGLSETFEIDLPNATVTLLRDGNYRLRVDSVAQVSFLVVRSGTAEVNAFGQAATINPGHSILLSGTNNAPFNIAQAPGEDDFDRWCHQRDDHEAHLASLRYVPPTLIGYEDLDDNGGWEQTAQYGAIWYPRAVPADWAPYRFGHWVWIAPWGWTWVDQANWGFAPFHYGRWVFVSGRWGWSPGPIVVAQNAPPVHPHYAPALVAWVGGPHVGVAVSVGAPLAWVTLGFGELYTPPYHCSQHYFSNVNVNNTRVVNNVNITNVYQTVYVNKTVYNQTYVHMSSPNAVVAMPQAAMASGKPVHQQAVVLKKEDIQNMQPAAAPAFVKSPPVVAAAPVARPPAPAGFAKASPQPQPFAAPSQPTRPPQPVAPAAVAKPVAAQVTSPRPAAHEYPEMTKRTPPPPAPKKEEKKKDEHKDKKSD